MLDRLLHDLTCEGSVIERDSEDGPFVISVYEGRRLDPPVRLFLSAQGFDAHLRRLADQGAREVFPDVEPIIGAYRLFTVHLKEEILQSGRKLTELRLSDWGFDATGSEFPREVLDPADGPFRWVSERSSTTDVDQD